MYLFFIKSLLLLILKFVEVLFCLWLSFSLYFDLAILLDEYFKFFDFDLTLFLY
jgi:hypothetical protein